MLIDRDKAYKVLTDYYHHKTGMQHEVLQDALSKVPEVNAIPIEWIKEWAMKSENTYNREQIIEMLKDWREENDL